MNIKECYAKMEADYDGVMSFLTKEERIKKYLLKFLDRTDYEDLEKALAEERYEDAFRASHDLKGVSLNLCFTNLQRVSSELCEELRHGKPAIDVSEMLANVKKEYDIVKDAISGLDR